MNAETQPLTQILPTSEEHLPVIAELAGVIWRACYPKIISHAQIEYMLARMYSLDTLREELRSQGIRYNLLLVERQPAGFAAYGPTPEPGVMKLHKLYVVPKLQGRGLGSLLLRHIEEKIRSTGAHRLVLSVNKRNAPAIAAYQKNGYAIVESVITDIGSGFVMDDYIMSKDIAKSTCERLH